MTRCVKGTVDRTKVDDPPGCVTLEGEGLGPDPRILRTFWAGHQAHILSYISLFSDIPSATPTVVCQDPTEIIEDSKRDDTAGLSATTKYRGERTVQSHIPSEILARTTP